MVGAGNNRARGLFVLLAAALALVLVGAPRAEAAGPRGFDISHWNGPIDWIHVSTGGFTFVFAKATEGRTLTDPTYGINRSGANAFGLSIGAYHFARPSGRNEAEQAASAIGQADHFVDVAEPQPGDLPPALDLETTGGLGSTALTRWTQIFLDEVEARTGVKALVYASPNFWQHSLDGTTSFALAGHRLWIAHWTRRAAPSLPASSWGGLGWTFWQWTNCSTIPGFAHCADGDRFNGSSVSAVEIPGSAATRPQVQTRPSIVGTAQVGKPASARPGRWSGQRPLSFAYQWQSCAAGGGGCVPIAGAVHESYTPTLADLDSSLAVSVTARSPAGTATATSRATKTVAKGGKGGAGAIAPVATTPPQMTGTPEVGQVLSAVDGAWTGSPSGFEYQWQRCDAAGACGAIADATAPQYTVTPDDIGASLELVVSAKGAGGTTSIPTSPTGAVVPATVPAPAVGSTVTEENTAGAVVTADHGATVTWQPGVVPSDATVTLERRTAKNALPGTGVALGIQPLEGTLKFPVDVVYPTAPADAVPGVAAGSKIFRPAPPVEVPVPRLPDGANAGSYRDGTGALHVLTRTPGAVALFRSGGWGDPRRVSADPPSLIRVSGSGPLHPKRRGDGTLLVLTRLNLDSQAHLYAMLLAPGGTRPPVLKKGSRLGVWLHGAASKTVQSMLRKPGGFPVRLRASAKRLHPGRYRLRVAAVDPYGRKAQLLLPVEVSRAQLSSRR